MATNQIVPFATSGGANVQDLASYLAAASTANGYSAGIAQSNALNRTWRQSAFMAAALASHIANFGMDVLDNGDVATVAANLRRLMGNLAGVPGLTVSTTLTVASVGQLVVLLANNLTTTLPRANTCPVGSEISFLAPSTTGGAIAVQGGDRFITGNSLSTSPLLLGAGDTATLVGNGTDWYLKAGSLSLNSAGVFSGTKGAAPTQRLPGGLLLQTGLQPAGSGTGTLSFPTSFPTACSSVQATATGAESVNVSSLPSVSGVSFTRTLLAGGAGSAPFFWTAIGY